VQNRSPTRPDPELLSEAAAARLLARASELDAAGRAGSEVADLRLAAAEAGISAHAFDAALAELQRAGQARAPDVSAPPRRRRLLWAFATGAAAIMAGGALTVWHDWTPAGPPMVEEAMLLRCLSPGEAAELVRPHLTLRSNRVVYPAANASRVLTLRATPAQLQQVRSVLAAYEGTGSPACATRPAPTGTS
jgi:hypothetical protein